MARNAREILAAFVGEDYDCNINWSTSGVLTAPLKLLGANPKRYHLAISSLQGWTTFFGFDSSVTTAKGIPVAAGMTFELDYLEDFDLVTREIWCISNGVSNGLAGIAFLNILEYLVVGSEN